ncbi:putative DNA (cytosine-5)-methyltransferase CMT1 [Tanacetum coccineum]|uniref:DNA (cytosine-5-)-methyltransferase n=1 Tax=Tanacetum coccineum TaxID=301880 RepID=A0ABQ5J4K4_9ASTR
MAKQTKRSRKPETQLEPVNSSPTDSTPKSEETETKPSQSSRSYPKRAKKAVTDPVPVNEPVVAVNEEVVPMNVVEDNEDEDVRFVGKPVPADEARARWPHRYETKARVKLIPATNTEDEKEIYQARCHYTKAVVDGVKFELNECAYVKAEEGEPDYIARIVELFETVDKQLYFSAQWFFRAGDTVIKSQAHLIDRRRVFYSEMKDDNPLDSIVSKVTIVQLPPDVHMVKKEESLEKFDYYYDMQYSKPVTFTTLHTDCVIPKSESPDTSSAGEVDDNSKGDKKEVPTLTLLDLYAGCGAMSTGLCYGTRFSGIKLETKWAVDMNEHACESLKINHPETQVRNESAEDFFTMLKEWEKLCVEFGLIGTQRDEDVKANSEESDSEEIDEKKQDDEEFEVGKFLAVCYGDPNKTETKKLHFKVRWKGYSSKHDTWEPYDSLSECNCKEAIKEFVTRGYHSKMLPLRGDVDFICGGPPCQGISGHNRFRNYENPLQDEKNHQLVVFMDIIDFLKPKFVLMENVVDMIKFAKGILGYHAVGRLVAMNYQTRLGIMAAGSYGVSQCRYRMFLWGASTMMNLPQFPLPTHEVVGKGVVPVEFKDCVLGSDDDDKSYKLEKSIFLGDAISDLPEVTNYNGLDEMEYGGAPRTSFQKFIRMRKQAASKKMILYDHRPLELNVDDYARVCLIPKIKGANFRNLAGVLVDMNNKVYWDSSVDRVKLPSGKPLVPDYCMTFVRGTSKKPFGRLGMDSVVKTVVGRAEPHNQALLHPNQDRVLTIRENARLQGFPDHYRLCGPIKERYLQVGNAVSFAVSTALGYALARAIQGESTSERLRLPVKFPDCLGSSLSKQEEE